MSAKPVMVPAVFNWAGKPLTPEWQLAYADSFMRLPCLLLLVPFCESRRWFRLLGEQWTKCDNVGRHRLNLEVLFQLADRCSFRKSRKSVESLTPLFALHFQHRAW